jgi:hypothetical protein
MPSLPGQNSKINLKQAFKQAVVLVDIKNWFIVKDMGLERM